MKIPILGYLVILGRGLRTFQSSIVILYLVGSEFVCVCYRVSVSLKKDVFRPALGNHILIFNNLISKCI